MEKTGKSNVDSSVLIPILLNVFFALCFSYPQALLLPLCCIFGFTTKVYKLSSDKRMNAAVIGETALMAVQMVFSHLSHGRVLIELPVDETAASIVILGASVGTTLYIGWVVRNRIKVAKRVVEEKNVKAETDKLTGLPNRQSMDAFIIRQASFAMTFSIIMMDIDNFKKVNDTYGHTEGDAILQDLAASIKASIRQSDKCFRYGGEEFCVVCPQSTAEQARAVAERIRTTFNSHEHTYDTEPEPKRFSVSLGIAECRYGEFVATDANGLESANDEDKVVALISKADTALYKAKHTGKNKAVIFYPDMLEQ